jgi:hypothetical protein
MEDDDLFPFGLWDVEGMPVVVLRTPDGGATVVRVFEDGSTAPCAVGDILGKGVELTRERFVEAFPYAAGAVA